MARRKSSRGRVFYYPSSLPKMQVGGDANQENDEYSTTLDLISTYKGHNPSAMREALNKIAWHETGMTLNPKQLQGNDPKKPGKGLYQFEKDSLATAIQSAKNFYKSIGEPVPDWINNLNTTDATTLSASQQSSLAALSMVQKKNFPVRQALESDEGLVEAWAKGWQTKNDPAKKALFKEHLEIYKDKGIKTELPTVNSLNPLRSLPKFQNGSRIGDGTEDTEKVPIRVDVANDNTTWSKKFTDIINNPSNYSQAEVIDAVSKLAAIFPDSDRIITTPGVSPSEAGTRYVEKDPATGLPKLKKGGNIQKQGYKYNSPYRKRRYIDIHSNKITMDDVPERLLVRTDTGEERILEPNSGEYYFPGANVVREMPLRDTPLYFSPSSKGLTKYEPGGGILSEPVSGDIPTTLMPEINITGFKDNSYSFTGLPTIAPENSKTGKKCSTTNCAEQATTEFANIVGTSREEISPLVSADAWYRKSKVLSNPNSELIFEAKTADYDGYKNLPVKPEGDWWKDIDFQVGDFVDLSGKVYGTWRSSKQPKLGTASKDGYNQSDFARHSGIIVGKTPEGIPIVRHNIAGTLYDEPITDISERYNYFPSAVYRVNDENLNKGKQQYSVKQQEKYENITNYSDESIDLPFTGTVTDDEGNTLKVDTKKVNKKLVEPYKEIRKDLVVNYGVSQERLDDIFKTLLAIGTQESNLGNMVDDKFISKAKVSVLDILADVPIGLINPLLTGFSSESVLKTAKGALNVKGQIENLLSDYKVAEVPTWKLDKEIALLEAQGVPNDEAIHQIFSQYGAPSKTDKVTDPSKGPFRQKAPSGRWLETMGKEYSTTEAMKKANWGKEWDDSNKNFIANAIGLYLDNYDQAKKLYGENESEEFLNQVATLAHNAPTKAFTKEYTDFYIKGIDNPDPAKYNAGYVNKVYNAKNSMFRQPKSSRENSEGTYRGFIDKSAESSNQQQNANTPLVDVPSYFSGSKIGLTEYQKGGQLPMYQDEGSLPKAQVGRKVVQGEKFDNATLANEEISSAYNASVSEEIKSIDTSRYGIKVIQYPIGFEKMPPGHIEAVLYDKETGDIVNEIPDTEFVGYINRWTDEGNRRVNIRDYEVNGKNREGVRTIDLELPDADVKKFISTAQLFTPSTKDRIHERLGLTTSELPISSGDIYTYDFLESNCATGVCMGLGLNETQAESAGITDPLITMDNLINKYGKYAKNIRGKRVSKKEGLSKVLQQVGLPEFNNPQTLNTTLKYLDSLERGELVKALEDLSKIPTVQGLAKGNLEVKKLKDVSNIVGDAIDVYDALPEGTIPTALKGVHYTYLNPVIKENTPFDISPQGVDNIIPWWKKQAEEVGEGVQGAWDATKGVFGFQRGGSINIYGDSLPKAQKGRRISKGETRRTAPTYMLDEVTVEAFPDATPAQKAALSTGPGNPIYRSAKLELMNNKKPGNFANETKDAFGYLVAGAPMEVLQTPQSLLVEGIEAARGNDYNFKNAFPQYVTNAPNKQRLPSQTFLPNAPFPLQLAGDILIDPFVVAGAAKGGINAARYVKNFPKAFALNLDDVGAKVVKQGGFDGNFITRPLTPYGTNELTPGSHLYRKIGNKKGLQDLIEKGGAQAPAPMRMKSRITVDTPFFGVGKTPIENYRGIFAVETPLPSQSKYRWSNYVGGSKNYGVAPYDKQTGSLLKKIPLEDLEVYRKKWFSNNYKKLDKSNLEEGMKYADAQVALENMWKWGSRGYIAHEGLSHYSDSDNIKPWTPELVKFLTEENKIKIDPATGLQKREDGGSLPKAEVMIDPATGLPKLKKGGKAWIQGAIKKPGALRATAKRAGAIKSDGTIKKSWLREKAKQGNSITEKRARLALTLGKMKK